MTNRRLLIVDDDKVTSDLFRSRLLKRGYDCIILDDGNSILDAIEKHKIELVLLDIIMPKISGMDVLRSIRAAYEQVELPVIMVTAKDLPKDITEALREGASDFLTKPIHIDVAVARIDTQLKVVDLHHLSTQRQQVEAVHAMVITYNHEINNPLSVAMGNLTLGMEKNDRAALVKVEAALFRIADIVKKIADVSRRSGPIELEQYSGARKMIKI